MIRIQIFCFILWMSAYCAQGDKYTDENRPYEFGFTIEGEQHRHEKKDENGIIMGEFGFITADGVYHVTVYATDENGNFKILSMKNIRVKPYPTGPTQNTRQGHSLQLSSSHQPKTNEETKSSAQNIKQKLNPGPAKTCSHCSVPTTTTQSPKLSNDKSLKNYNKQQENEYNTNIQSNTNSFRRNNFNQDYNTQEKTQQNKQKLSDRFNKKPFTSNDQTVTEQVYLENFNIKQPSREISTPFISNYPQNSDIGQNVPQEEKDSFVNYPQTYENSPQVPRVVSRYPQGSSPLNFNTEKLRPETLGQTGIGQTGIGQTGIGQTGIGQTGIGQTGIGQTGIGQTGIGQTGIGQTGIGQTGIGQTGIGQTGIGQTGIGLTEVVQTGIGQTEVGQTGIGQTGFGQSEIGYPEIRQPEIGQTEIGQTGIGQAGIEQKRIGLKRAEIGHTLISQTGNLPENNNFNLNKYKTNPNGGDEKLYHINKANNRPNTVLPQNSINANRQPKSFNDILESVNPELEYRNAVQPQGSLQPGFNNLPKKPVLVAAQMEIVDRNTDIYHKNPGEKDGLPQGLTSVDMKQLLYTFNYTLGFHGHHEEGYTNGAKYGYYFVTGRNGVRTRVDYTADETGFHPKISQEVLDILSDDVPKPETEKDEKYGLRGYEFKWLYYPADST